MSRDGLLIARHAATTPAVRVMRYRPLGHSGLMVSELCLGTMIFGEDSPRSTDAATAEEGYPYRMMRVYGNR